MTATKCNTCGHYLPVEDFHNVHKSKRCKPCTSERGKAAYNTSTTLKSGIMLRNRKKLVQRYGLTWEQFISLWEHQDGRCAICSVEVDTFAIASAATAACIDHDHITNKVRGILCRCCNLALGYMKDNPEALRKAAIYLEDN